MKNQDISDFPMSIEKPEIGNQEKEAIATRLSRRVTANRTNARRSTGPKTPQGKAIVTQNPLKHGVFSKQVVLGNESQEEFNALQQEFYNYFHPLGLLETLFCERALAAAWRLSRVTLMESLLLNQAARQSLFGDDTSEIFGNTTNDRLALLSRYEISLEKMLFRSLSELRVLQADRQGNTLPNGFVSQNLTEDLDEEK